MDREKEGFPITAIREVKLLSKLSHRNVVDLRTVVQAKDLSSFFLVFEFVDNDLTGIIENAPLKSDQIKVLLFRIDCRFTPDFRNYSIKFFLDLSIATKTTFFTAI